MSNNDDRIPKYIDVTGRMIEGDYHIQIDNENHDEVGILGANLQNLANVLDNKVKELQHVHQLTAKINSGMLLTDILDTIYTDFYSLIPYDRIGFSIIEYENNQPWVQAYWSRTTNPKIEIGAGYRAPLTGSSLEKIVKTQQPRIINDLEAYYKQKPTSEPTRRILAEGIRSSLTCPLIVNGNPVGFIFFSSCQPNTYQDIHVETFQEIAGQLAVIVEKGWFVSELAQKQAAIEAQNEELRRLHRSKNDFLGMAAHDLRNPIGNIQSVAEMLIDPEWVLTAEEKHRFIEGILRQTGYMLAILDDLLDITQIESGTFQVRRIAVDVRQLLQETIKRHQRIAAVKGSQLALAACDDGELLADPIRLMQVLDNLLSNALKYSPPNSLVSVSATHRKKDWYFEIRDQGPGISPEEQSLLFKEFAKLTPQPTAGETSTGLGLAITRRMIEAQNGEIGFYNLEGGVGAAFWFTLPIQAKSSR